MRKRVLKAEFVVSLFHTRARTLQGNAKQLFDVDMQTVPLQPHTSIILRLQTTSLVSNLSVALAIKAPRRARD